MRIAGLLAMAAALMTQTSCGVPKKIRNTVETITEVVDRTEKLAQGDTTQVLPLAALALNNTQDYAVVHQEDRALVAEVKMIPGLGIKVPRSDDNRYYLRMDFENDSEGTQMNMSFFSAPKGVYKKVKDADDIIAKGASPLFKQVIEGMMLVGMCMIK